MKATLSYDRPVAVLTAGPKGGLLGPSSSVAARLAAGLCERSDRPLSLLLPSQRAADDESVRILRAELFGQGVETEIVDARGDLERERQALASADHRFEPRGWHAAAAPPSAVWSVGPFSPRKVRRIIVAHDLADSGRAALELGAALARTANARLEVVHAWQLPMALQIGGGRGVTSADRRRYQEELLDELRRDLDRLETDARVRLPQTTPAHALHCAADELAPDVIVVGQAQRAGLGKLLGATGKQVERFAACTVLTAPCDWPLRTHLSRSARPLRFTA